MKYIKEFRDADLAKIVANKIATEVKGHQQYRLMEFCGGHTHAIHRYGIPDLLPNNINMIHGPGCPVCVLPIARIDQAIALAELPNVILCSYADMLRVLGTGQKSLLKAKANGADVRMVYSINDALAIAQKNLTKEIIFFAIGFETTTPPTAVALLKAKQLQLKNFSVFCNHVLTPAAMDCLLQEKNDGPPVQLDGFVGPAHVSIVIGSDAYKKVAERYQKPIVISGFEPLDLLQSILMLVQLINKGNYGVENQYTRAVNPQGNIKSQAIMAEVFELKPTFEWRGLGFMPESALQIKSAYKNFDAEYRFPMQIIRGQEHKACECGAILRGAKKPLKCHEKY